MIKEIKCVDTGIMNNTTCPFVFQFKDLDEFSTEAVKHFHPDRITHKNDSSNFTPEDIKGWKGREIFEKSKEIK